MQSLQCLAAFFACAAAAEPLRVTCDVAQVHRSDPLLRAAKDSLLEGRAVGNVTLGPLMRNPRYGDGGADDEEAAKAVIAGEKATTAIATSRRSRWLALAAIATAAAVAAAVLVRRRRA